MKKVLALPLLVLLSFFSDRPFAGTVVVPPAVYRLNAQAGGGSDTPLFTSDVPGTLQSSGSSSLGSGSTTVTVGAFPSPFIDITGTIARGPDAPDGGVQSFASIFYYFQAVAPMNCDSMVEQCGNVVVPIDIVGLITTSESGSGTDLLASASFQAVSNNLNERITAFAACNFVSGCGTIPVTGVLNVLSANGSIYDPSASILNLTASVLGVTQPDGGTAHAFVDPILTIDPIFAANNPGYTLVFSEGIGNNPISPVPEPSSFVLMLSGIGAMGYVARRRQARNGPRSPSAG